MKQIFTAAAISLSLLAAGCSSDGTPASQTSSQATSSPTVPTAATASLFSEAGSASTISVVGMINSNEWGGNSTDIDQSSTEVTPLEGNTVMTVNFQDDSAGWGGAVFNLGDTGADLSGYESVKFGIDTSGMPGFKDMQVKLEDVDANGDVVYLSSYNTPLIARTTISGNWTIYEIPLADFPPNIDLTKVKYFGLWNPSSIDQDPAALTFGKLHFDDIHFVEADTTAAEPLGTAGIYSSTHTATTISTVGIINSIDWGGNRTDADPDSTAVTALEGSTVMSVNFQDDSAGWGGAVFNFGDSGQDISSYATLKFGLNTSGMSDYADMQIKFEDTSANGSVVYLSAYTASVSGDWSVYEIPLEDFAVNIDRSSMKFLGLWNPSSVNQDPAALAFGTLYFDDIHLIEGASSDDPVVVNNEVAAGIFTESTMASTIGYDAIINSIDWGGNRTDADPNSTAVTPLEGIYVLSVDYQDDSAGWGGAVFNFGDAGKDISSNATLNFGIDTSGMPGFADMQIKFEDTSAVGDVVYLSNYSPTTSGNWSLYEIPLSDFPASIDRTKIKFLGLWNPSSVAAAPTPLTFGSLHFDNIRLVEAATSTPSAANAVTTGVFSETNTATTVANQGIINSADWGGNPTSADTTSTAVTPLDGIYVMSVDFQDISAGWGGAVFNFGDNGVDISANSKLKFGIDTSGMSGYADMQVKFEDTSANGDVVYLSRYTPATSGNWSVYEIPLADYPAHIDMTKIKFLGLWNPSSVNEDPNALAFGLLHFDDIHLVE